MCFLLLVNVGHNTCLVLSDMECFEEYLRINLFDIFIFDYIRFVAFLPAFIFIYSAINN